MSLFPFNWIDQVIEEEGKKVGGMLNEEALRGKTMGEIREETTIEGLMKKYPWWMPTTYRVRVIAPSDKTEDKVFLFERKNT